MGWKTDKPPINTGRSDHHDRSFQPLSFLPQRDRRLYHTVTGYRKDLLAFARWYAETFGEDPAPEKITSIDLREYQSWKRNVKGLKPNTVNRRMKAVKSWLS
ncbi:site-specific integrase [Moorellaceae bacterium AZ2]